MNVINIYWWIGKEEMNICCVKYEELWKSSQLNKERNDQKSLSIHDISRLHFSTKLNALGTSFSNFLKKILSMKNFSLKNRKEKVISFLFWPRTFSTLS